MNRGRLTQGPSSWSRSAQFRSIGRAAITSWNTKRTDVPRCGAARKSDRGPCRQWPMTNGRCYLHGGATPRGAEWHRRQLPKALKKLDGKLRHGDRQARRRASRVAAMTIAEKKSYVEWQRTHAPGPPEPRANARLRRKQDREAAMFLASRRTPQPDQVADVLGTEIAELRSRAVRIVAGGDTNTEMRKGVFE